MADQRLSRTAGRPLGPALDPGLDRRGLGLLALAVFSVGAAAVLIRLAAAPALTTAFVRLAVGGGVLALGAAVRCRSQTSTLSVASLPRLVTAGGLLALHFALWIASLSFTTVAASVVLVCLQPVFVALLARALLNEVVGRRVAAGIAIALTGAAVIATAGADGTPAAGGPSMLVGNLLALLGAIAIALYVLVLRSQRGDVVLSSAIVTVTAALALLPACLILGEPLWPATTSQVGWLVALALGPQVVGHTALNAALQRLPAAMVSGSILGEPVIASALAWLCLGERPSAATLLGGAITLVGVGVLLSRASTEET